MHSIRLVLIFSLVVSSLVGVGPSLSTGQCAFVFADDFSSNSVGTWGVDLSDRDPSVKPGDDFFMSQNGGWFTRTELTPQLPQAAYWRDLRRLSPQRLNEILAAAAAKKSVAPESLEAKAGAFYRAFMDEQTIEAKGLTPMKPEFMSWNGWWAGLPWRTTF